MTAPPPTLRAVFERAASPNSLAWRDVRLSPDGVATFTAVAVADVDMGICSVLMGADCHTGHMTCCYCLDEFVAGALFDTGRQRVVTWSPHEAGFLALHVFSLSGAEASCALLMRFTVSYVPGHKLQRIEWAGDRILLWLGDANDEWVLSYFDLRESQDGEPTEHADDEPRVALVL